MNQNSCLAAVAISAALATSTPDAFAQGVKRVVNAGNVTLDVTIRGRAGLDLGKDRGVVSATIPPGQSVRLTYGDAANPFMNELDAWESTRKSMITTTFRSSDGGNGALLNDLFNTHNTLILAYRPRVLGYTLQATNGN